MWTKSEVFKNIKLNAISVYDGRYIKIKIRAYGHKVYTNFLGLNFHIIFYSLFYWFFIYLRKLILSASIFKQMYF